MTEERRAKIENLFGKRLKIVILEFPEHPTQRGGVAFVMNRSLVNVENMSLTEIVPGREALLKMTQHKNKKIFLLAIYAPNITAIDAEDNAAF